MGRQMGEGPRYSTSPFQLFQHIEEELHNILSQAYQRAGLSQPPEISITPLIDSGYLSPQDGLYAITLLLALEHAEDELMDADDEGEAKRVLGKIKHYLEELRKTFK